MTSTTPRLRVMTAEDNDDIRSLVKFQLELAGNDIVEATDGATAIHLLQEEEVDVVVLDVDLPGMSGLDVLAKMKSNPETADIPVVMLTADSGPTSVIHALEQGAHDYVTKPFARGELIARVHSAGRVKALQDRLREQNRYLEHLSETDPLTGLHNRRYAEHQLDSAVANARRHGTPLSVLLIDVDHFKAINDNYGHPAGDEALRVASKSLLTKLRAGDVAARWGGEEFLVVMPMTDVQGAAQVAERIRVAIADAPIPIGAEAVALTLSIGCAEGDDTGTLLKRADEALYAAKAAGRNRVTY